jgi:periplasmic protein TonB
LTLAIVSDDARLPEALRAGANSVLVKPIRTEQVRDTMSTACELLRAKQQPGAPQPLPVAQREASETATLAAAASTGAGSVPAPAPSSVTQAPEKTFRAGEFLQFDTENEVHKSTEQSAATEVNALTELEPTAAAVTDAAPEPAKPQEPLTGWASLQARLMKAAPEPEDNPPAKNELLSYENTRSSAGSSTEESRNPAKPEPQPESGPEAALFAYISGEPEQIAPPAREPRSKLGKILWVGILAACVVLAATPRARQSFRMLYGNAVRAGGSWLNPRPNPVPQAVPQHDSFGQSGDEYNLPVVGNIPDATTDPSQIRVLPVIDPTAKPQKGSEANGGQAAPATPSENNPTDQTQAAQNQTDQNQPSQNQAGQSPNGQAQVGESQVKDPAAVSVVEVPGNAAEASPGPAPAAAPVLPNTPVAQAAAPQRPVTASVQSSPPQKLSTADSAGIPSSLKSQIASMTPEASGTKPAEAAMSSIEPVNLPESAALGLLAQPVDPIYPDAAKASGQRGSVVLQVLIGRDGAVQDAKFLQGSLVFARSAIDAVKQWRFKPYSMNGRAVSVQSVITLNFKPPA